MELNCLACFGLWNPTVPVHLQACYAVKPKPRLAHIRNPNPSHIRDYDNKPAHARHFAWWKEGCSGWEATLKDVIKNKIHGDGPFLGVLPHHAASLYSSMRKFALFLGLPSLYEQ